MNALFWDIMIYFFKCLLSAFVLRKTPGITVSKELG